ncbi:RagB/SusD family nutrient uptake outer membrane protein [Lunatibacter salilacus]|uniref:RagB/SusD family nutrient uptake outer membrane protein n=1 Tax=Lunatibacter salilacus TaxID=2483804 RepID=UPI00131E0EB8|nr:RagB/SusD family nutrient uptake outer membrane protein [Lunatibacter salilacus]
MKTYRKLSLIGVLSILILLGQTGCQDWLDEQPLVQLSEGSFWNSESDGLLALTGIYNGSNVGINAYTNELLILSSATDDSSYKFGAVGNIYSGYLRAADTQVVLAIWQRAYRTIFKVNYFLENIDRVEMDSGLKAQWIAEAKFLRAYEYFYMSILYGGVPLITSVLTIEEANSQTRNSLSEIVEYSIQELTAAAQDLPATRPASERGRIVKAAPLAIKGRLLMIHNRWSEAVSTYEEIIGLDAHQIDPRYKAIFEEEGETSSEIILATNMIAGLYGNTHNQRNHHPEFYGGYSEVNPFQGMVDAFLMTDGLPIEESPLYDPQNPFDNRDPRLYASVFLPEYTEFRGRLFLAHPDRTGDNIAALPGATGYGWKKYVTEDFAGDFGSSGDDNILVRYAEVLLSYLESKIENGDNITQELLDQTINQVRGRQEVGMPPVTETDPAQLTEILRRERRVEFCIERIIRYMDIRRWGIFMEVMNRQFYGMKLTDDADNYSDYTVETTGRFRGHYKVINKTGSVTEDMALIPIPLSEIDLNPSLEQNPGY